MVVGVIGGDGFLGLRNLTDPNSGQTPLILMAMVLAIVVIGGGPGLSLVIGAVVNAHVGFELFRAGIPGFAAFVFGAAGAIATDMLNGALVTYFTLPSLVVTIGTGLMVLGIAPLTLFGVTSYASPAGVTVARSSVPRSRDGQTRAEERHFQDLVGHR